MDGRQNPHGSGPALGASAVGDQDAEHEIYCDEVICEYPQSGERIHGRAICKRCEAAILTSLAALWCGAYQAAAKGIVLGNP